MPIIRRAAGGDRHTTVGPRVLGLVSLVILSLIAAAAHAESAPPEYDRVGWYLGLGGYYAISDFDLSTSDLDVVPPEPANTDPDFGGSGGVDFRAGYRAFSLWAFEFDYQWQAGYDSKESSVDPLLEIDTHLLSLNAKLFALSGRWQPYALLGASLLIFNTEIVDDAFKKPWDLSVGFAPRFGAGVDFWIDENWGVMVEGTYIVPVGVLDGANMGSVGAGFQYRF
jgi:opacity protein-like surface antigen